jgi:AsmA protein
MKFALRLLAGLVVLFLVVVIGLGAYFAFLFDPNDYRDRLVTMVKAQTGRTLDIKGDIALSLFPWLGFSVGATELGNAPGFSERPFASLAKAEARVRLLPLLSSTVAIDRVTLHGLQLSLERRKDGRTNWADLSAKDEASAHEGEPAGGPGEDAGGATLLSVGGIEVADAAIHWSDARTGADYVLSDVRLTTGAIAPGEPFDFQGGLGFAAAEPAVLGQLALSGLASLDAAAGAGRIERLRVTLKAEGAGVPGGKLDAGLLAETAALDMGAGTATLAGLNLRVFDVQLNGALGATGLGKTPAVTGQLAIDGFNPRAFLTALGAQVPPTANAERLKRASFRADLDGSDTRMALRNIVASLDDSEIKGELELTDLARQAIRFDLQLNALDVDSYLPPAAVGKEGEPAARAPAGGAAKPQPLDLRGKDVAGRLRVGQLTAGGMKLSDVDTRLTLAGGRLELVPAASLYSGRLEGRAVVSGNGQSERLAVTGGLKEVRIDPLLRDLTGKPERLSGLATVRSELNATALSGEALKQSLAGTVALNVRDGAIKGVNIAQFLREAQARLTGNAAEASAGVQQTDFSALDATIALGGGVARNNDLSLSSPLLRVNGEGSANLVSERIDYLVKTSLVGTLTGQGGKSLDQVRGVTVPVRVGGSFAEPTYRLDVEALLAEAAKAKLGVQKEQVQEQVKAVREKAKEQLKDELRKGLGELFK